VIMENDDDNNNKRTKPSVNKYIRSHATITVLLMAKILEVM